MNKNIAEPDPESAEKLSQFYIPTRNRQMIWNSSKTGPTNGRKSVLVLEQEQEIVDIFTQ